FLTQFTLNTPGAVTGGPDAFTPTVTTQGTPSTPPLTTNKTITSGFTGVVTSGAVQDFRGWTNGTTRMWFAETQANSASGGQTPAQMYSSAMNLMPPHFMCFNQQVGQVSSIYTL